MVKGDVRFSKSMTIAGEVNLILEDGCHLYADDGIWVKKDAKFSIWAQSTKEKMGQVEAKASSHYYAGIGGIESTTPGEIHIYGGKITATGGYRSAGIGAGGLGTKVNIFIEGGDVTATGADGGPGIGAGSCETSGETMEGKIQISGGCVTATGSLGDRFFDTKNSGGAGIGAGFSTNCAIEVIITGGEVTAKGMGQAAAIGGGAEDGTGSGGEGGKVIIEGGRVKALSNHTAIGHGSTDRVMGELIIGQEMKVQAGNNGETYEGTFPADSRVTACQYRHNALIEPCEHPESEGFLAHTPEHHIRRCK